MTLCVWIAALALNLSPTQMHFSIAHGRERARARERERHRETHRVKWSGAHVPATVKAIIQ